MASHNKTPNELAKTVIEGVVDILAIVGLVVLAYVKVVDGATVVPLITLIAGASVGARLGGKPNDGSGGGGTPASVLLLMFTPLLQALGNLSRSSRSMLAMAALALSVAACGGPSTPASQAAVHRSLWTLLRGACAVVLAQPEPGTVPQSSGGETAP